MSKSLRMLLLSMLVIAVAAMPAMAATYPTFYWTGKAGDNYWGNVNNWSADIANAGDVAENEYYPGRVSADKVVISQDADIFLTTVGNAKTTGELLKGVGTISIDYGAKVSIDLGAYGYFSKVPDINVVSGSLKLSGPVTRTINTNPTWQSKGPLTLNLSADIPSGKTITLSVDNAALTINHRSLLTRTTIRVTGRSSSNKGQLVLNVSPLAAASGRKLSISLLNGAVLTVPSGKEVTLYANYDVSADNEAPLISGTAFTKAGTGKLTLTRTNVKSYDVPIASTVTRLTVSNGSLVLASGGIVGNSSIDVFVGTSSNSTAKLAVNAARAISSDKLVNLTVRGSAEIADAGIGSAKSVYKSSKLTLTPFNLSADVFANGTLTFKGNQPINQLKGAGTVVVSGDEAVLILKGNKSTISKFTGYLKATNVGIASSDFEGMPFEKAGDLDMAAVYVYGGATLSLDASNLPDGMDETTIFLRSDYNSVSSTALNASMVGDLRISGDVTLGTLKVDGTKNGVAGVLLPTSKDILTVNSLVLHANRALDTGASTTYSAADALLISGEGTLAPKTISNFTSDGGLGSERSITVEGATLKLDVNIPEYNSLLLEDGGTLDAANGVVIPGDLTIQASGNEYNVIKVDLTGDNVRLYTEGHNAVNVGGNLSLSGKMSFDVDLDDDEKTLGKRYKLIGPRGTSFSRVNSNDVEIAVQGTFNDVMKVSYDINGVYGILEKLIQQPKLGSAWKVSPLRSIEFEAKLSYDIPAKLEPAELIKFISVDVVIGGTTFNNAGTTRQLVQDGGKDLVYVSSFKVNSADKEIVLIGTLYAEELTTKVTLGWDKTDARSKDWKAYEGNMTFGGIDIQSQDFRPGNTVTLTFANPVRESSDVTPTEEDILSEDVTADPEEVALESEVHTVVAGSEDVVLTVNGIRRVTTGSNSFVPVLVNGEYVWTNGYNPATDKFEMLFDGIYRPVSLDIKINGVSVDMASVDITGDGPITVTIPAEFFTTDLAYTAPQEIVIVGTTPNGKTITTEPVSVWVKPASGYQAGTIDAEYVGRGASDTAVTRKVADIPLGGTISFDVTGGTMPDEWIDFDGVKAGVISFTVPAGTAAGVYTKTIDVYTAEGGYTYTFSYEVVEGFKINDPDEPYGTIGGLNYEARFTAANAPAGAKVEWNFATNLAWLNSAESGDVFVIYGQLPAYVNDDEAENDPNEYSYRVIAGINNDTASKDWTITIQEDTDETVPPAQFTAGTITSSGDISLANRSYNVAIAFNEDNTDTEIEFLSLPFWLKATPVKATVDDTEVITGYTLTYKNDTAVTAGETGVVRFEDPDSGNIVSWNVMFTETINPTPVPGSEFMYSVSGSTTVSVALAARDTSITITPRNARGEVTYASSASWVSVDQATGVVAITPADSSLVSSTPHTVIITLTDAGRTTANTVSLDLTITVTAGGLISPDVSPDVPPAPGSEFMYSVTGNTTVSVALAARDTSITITPRNARGEVTYASSASWVSVDQATGVVAINPTASSLVSSTPHTVTITLTDSGRTTANTQTVTLTITVTSGGVVPDTTLSLRVSPSPLNITLGSFGTVRLVASNVLGTAAYSMNAPEEVGGTISGDTAVFVPDEAGTYDVTFTVVDSGRTTDNSKTAALTINVTLPSSNVGSSGGGCDAGFGALALAIALPLFLRRRRS